MSLYAEHKKPLVDLENRKTVSHIEYDYQIKARALSLRVFANALMCIEANHQHHTMYDEYDGYKGSALEQDNLVAIQLLKTSLGL
jgi:hypothetical protein